LLASDDRFVVTAQSDLLDVVSNDQGSGSPRIVAIGQPDVGSVRITEENLIEVTMPRSFAGSLVFDYEITDDTGATSTATVLVESVNALAAVGGLVETKSEELASVEGFVSRTESLFGGLINIRLSTLQLALFSLAPFAVAFVFWVFRNRERLVAITGVEQGRAIDAPQHRGDTSVKLRHDSLVWTKQRTRTRSGHSETLVDLPGDRKAWIPTDNIVNTGY